jgi:hypothetical protein
MPEENGIRLITDANTTPLGTTEPATSGDTQPQASRPSTIKITLECDIDLLLLRKQKRALIGLREGGTITYEQETAAEGMLNLLDFIQDSILEQGLATEEEIFPRLPQLFDPEPSSLDAAA